MNRFNPFKRKSTKDTTENKKLKIVSFQEDWLRDNDFKDWVQKHPTEPQAVICKFCKKNVKFIQKSDLIKHVKTNVHKDNVEAAMKCGSFESIQVEGPSFKKRVQTAEMVTAYFLAEHNVGIAIADDLVSCIKRLSLDPESVQQMRIKRDKATGIIKNVLYKCAFVDVIKSLNSNFFSVMINESTDISSTKLLCVSVQYFDIQVGKVVQHLLQLIELDGRAGKAYDLYKTFEDFFVKNEINLNNIVALGCDNASIMVGKTNGFRKYLQEKVPHLITLNCICHSSALIAKANCSQIPKEVEDLLKLTYNYYCHSPKRFDELRENLRSYSLPEHKILKLSGTRGLEAHKCYERTREEWDALLDYFILEVFKQT